MTHRLLVALRITVCVGMFTAPHSGDADEVQNRKNEEKSKALAEVLQAQENHRGQVQSKQLELILVLDEAIPLIEGDINEFKTFEVRAGGGPRVFKTLKEKEEMIQSLEQVGRLLRKTRPVQSLSASDLRGRPRIPRRLRLGVREEASRSRVGQRR